MAHAVSSDSSTNRGVRWLAFGLMALFAMTAIRTALVSLAGQNQGGGAPAEMAARRADLVDRRGALLAITTPAYDLWAEPRWIADPVATVRALRGVLPDLDPAEAQARMRSDRAAVRLRAGLTPPQRAAVHNLGLAGIALRPTLRRFYPNLETGGRLLGRLNAEGAPISGVELGMQRTIAAASQAGRPVALSIDLRVQHAVERELTAALARFRAKAAAGLVVDGRSGEVLALASAPLYDPNAPLSGPPPGELSATSLFELGSTIKPFTVAAALDAGLTQPSERFDTRVALLLDGRELRDRSPAGAEVDLSGALARSSNVAVAALALRLGAERQRALFVRLGLAEASPLPIAGAHSFVLPQQTQASVVAANGYGRGPLFTLVGLAGAYTVFVNDGERVRLRLTPAFDEPPHRVAVFKPQTVRAVLAMLSEAVADGTGAQAAAPGLDIAGKTGTAEKLGADGRYDADRNLAVFAAVFPARAPRYVLVVALDEPQRTPASGNLATGGATAAPTAGRIAARIAPFLDLPSPRLAVDPNQSSAR